MEDDNQLLKQQELTHTTVCPLCNTVIEGFGDKIILNRDGFFIARNNLSVQLTRSQFVIMDMLLRSYPRTVLTVDLAYGIDSDMRANLRTIASHVSSIRKTLHSVGNNSDWGFKIQSAASSTIVESGYRLVHIRGKSDDDKS